MSYPTDIAMSALMLFTTATVKEIWLPSAGKGSLSMVVPAISETRPKSDCSYLLGPLETAMVWQFKYDRSKCPT